MVQTLVTQAPNGLGEGLSALGAAFEKSGERQRERNLKSAKSTLLANVLEQHVGTVSDPLQKSVVSSVLENLRGENSDPEFAESLIKKYTSISDSNGVGKTSMLLQEKYGFTPERAQREAKLYNMFSPGGQTDLIKNWNDEEVRNRNLSKKGKGRTKPEQEQVQPPGQEQLEQSGQEQVQLTGQEQLEQTGQEQVQPPGQEQEQQPQAEFDFPEVDFFEGMNLKEKTNMRGKLLTANSKKLDEAADSVDATEEMSRDLKTLSRLDESGKLPEGKGRLLINPSTGEAYFPFAQSPETQLYSKMINQFMKGAKEIFGARITNFEASTFLKMLPTLANSSDGRKLILEHMQIGNEFKGIKDQALLDVISHYGSDKIDMHQARRIAKDLAATREDKLIERMNNLVNVTENFTFTKETPEGMVPMERPDGTKKYVPKDAVNNYVDARYKVIQQ